MIVFDLELANRFSLLYEKPILILGCDKEGERTLKLLLSLETNIKGFLSFDQELKKFAEHQVFLITDFLDIYEEYIFILSGMNFSDRKMAVEIFKKNDIKNPDIYSSFGLDLAIYYNFNNSMIPGITRQKFLLAYDIWKENTRITTDYKQKICRLLPYIIDNQNVLIYQPGKVGSVSVEESLMNCKIPCVRSHGLLNSEEQEDNYLESYHSLVHFSLTHEKPLKIISLIREPIAKDIGHFFQKISRLDNDCAWFIKGFMSDNIYQSFYNYLSVVTPLRHLGQEDKIDYDYIACHIDYVGQHDESGALFGWFHQELKRFFNIDVYKEEFDKEQGYSIISKGNVELMLIKLEKLNDLEEEIGKFLGVPEFKLVISNEARFKEYNFAYKEFKEKVRLPEEYVDFYYKDNPYFEHFYTEGERKAFYEHWKQLIADVQ